MCSVISVLSNNARFVIGIIWTYVYVYQEQFVFACNKKLQKSYKPNIALMKLKEVTVIKNFAIFVHVNVSVKQSQFTSLQAEIDQDKQPGNFLKAKSKWTVCNFIHFHFTVFMLNHWNHKRNDLMTGMYVNCWQCSS